MKDEDRYALEVLNNVLNGQGGRLFLDLRDKKSLAYSVASLFRPALDRGLFGFYIASDPSKSDEAYAGLIAEIKRRSPSRGTLAQSVNVAQRAELYQRAGAHAVSVLTDSRFFHGSTDDLKLARSRLSVPVLRKDFIVSEYQVYESRAIGADAILLIVAYAGNVNAILWLQAMHLNSF